MSRLAHFNVLPISQSIIRNIRAECLFCLRINDIRTPFRQFESAFYAFDVPPANADPSRTRKIVQTPSNTRIVISMPKVAVMLFCKTDAPDSPVITALWRSQSSDAIQFVIWGDPWQYTWWITKAKIGKEQHRLDMLGPPVNMRGGTLLFEFSKSKLAINEYLGARY